MHTLALNPLWHCEYSVESDVSPEFAWSYWTDVRNWSDPPACGCTLSRRAYFA